MKGIGAFLAMGPKAMLAVSGAAVGLLTVGTMFFMSSVSSTSLMQGIDSANADEWNSSTGSSSSTPEGIAGSVVECARQQLGKPYIWGAEGPNSFDCSGLVTYCYRIALNVEIPHWTISQMADARYQTVGSVDELSAGDIILDGGLAPSHVGIYSGEQTVIHAPTFNDVVREVPLSEFYGWVGGNETFRHYIGG